MVYKRLLCSCVNCKAEIAINCLDKHFDSKQCKSGGKFVAKKYTDCPYCYCSLAGINTPNHMKWCKNNPDRGKGTIDNPSAGKQMQTSDAIRKRNDGIRKAHADGKYVESNQKKIGKPGKLHSAETKELMRQKALASPHRRLVRSIRDYVKKDGSIVKLDSSWEEALATRLDELDVKWIRPTPVKWIDNNGIYHNYFPDFYLPDYDVYLDPKGPYTIKAQQDKIKCLTEQIKNLIIITTLTECKNFTPHTKDLL